MAVPRFRRKVSSALAISLLASAAIVVMTVSAPSAFASGPASVNKPVNGNAVDPFPLTLSFPAPPRAHLNTAYSDTLVATGGVSPYAWSVSAGSLPDGITLDAATGVLAGTPTAPGTASFTVEVTDDDQQTATEATTLVVAPAITLAASMGSVSFGAPVTFSATITPAGSGSIAFKDLLSSGPQSGQTVTLGTVSLSRGTANLTIVLPAFNTNTVTATYSGDTTYANNKSAPVAVQVNAYSGELLIEQFRFSGPSGNSDQYVELYNNGAAAPLAGFRLTVGSGASITVPSSAPTLPTGDAYLITGRRYSLSAVAAADLSAASLGSDGLEVTAPDQAATVVDAVGPSGAPTGFFSGSPLPALSGTPIDQYAWVREETSGAPDNTGDNASDFQLVSTTGGVVGGVQSTLGSPSPLASGSPSQANADIRSALLDPAEAASAAPNFVYVRGTPGLLTVRRTLTNISAANLTSAEIRITDLSEANGAPEPGVSSQPPHPAALRVVDPATATSQVTVTGGAVVTVQNLSVDAPADPSPGGGLNTTLSIPLPGGLAPGGSVSIALTFAVDHGGSYWFSYDIDAPSALNAAVAPGLGAPRPTRGVAPSQAARGKALRTAGASGVLR